MWPYGGGKVTEILAMADINVNKKFEGDWNNREFKFQINLGEHQDTSGIVLVGARFPMEMKATKDGELNFPAIYFESEGTYRFEIYEVIPEESDPNYDSTIKYDRSVYILEIVVEYDTGSSNKLEVTSQNIYIYKDANGEIQKNIQPGSSDLSILDKLENKELATFENKLYNNNETHIIISGDKTYNSNDVDLRDFTFTLDVVPPEDSPSVSTDVKDGIINSFPIKVSPTVDGHFEFNVEFSKEGEYTFYAWENIRDLTGGDSDSYDNVYYDQSVYRIDVKVSQDNSGEVAVLTATKTITQIVDYLGEEVNKGVGNIVSGIEFDNFYILPMLPRTGGMGVDFVYKVGLALMTVSICAYGYYVIRYRKNRK